MTDETTPKLWTIKDSESGDILHRLPIDAKEMVATGRYEHVSGKVEPHGTGKPVEKPNDPALPVEFPEDLNDLAKAVKKFNTEELNKVIEKIKITVDDWAYLNLKQKRDRLATAILAKAAEEDKEG